MSGRLITALAFLVGVILLYSAVKNKDPRTVVKTALKGG